MCFATPKDAGETWREAARPPLSTRRRSFIALAQVPFAMLFAGITAGASSTLILTTSSPSIGVGGSSLMNLDQSSKVFLCF